MGLVFFTRDRRTEMIKCDLNFGSVLLIIAAIYAICALIAAAISADWKKDTAPKPPPPMSFEELQQAQQKAEYFRRQEEAKKQAAEQAARAAKEAEERKAKAEAEKRSRFLQETQDWILRVLRRYTDEANRCGVNTSLYEAHYKTDTNTKCWICGGLIFRFYFYTSFGDREIYDAFSVSGRRSFYFTPDENFRQVAEYYQIVVGQVEEVDTDTYTDDEGDPVATTYWRDVYGPAKYPPISIDEFFRKLNALRSEVIEEIPSNVCCPKKIYPPT